MTHPPQNDYEALKLALSLSITAPTDEQAADCLAIAKSLASKLRPEEVEQAKLEVGKWQKTDGVAGMVGKALQDLKKSISPTASAFTAL